MTTARIMTYNIQRCQGVDGEFNPDRVLNVIADAAPDIVALQETGAGHRGDPLPYLAEHLGMGIYRDPAGMPAAFLSHLPLRGVQAFGLGDGGYCLRADVDFARGTAKTTYGTCGVKVWVFKGEPVAKNEQPLLAPEAPAAEPAPKPAEPAKEPTPEKK